jgi:hypothetical protein
MDECGRQGGDGNEDNGDRQEAIGVLNGDSNGNRQEVSGAVNNL